MSHLSFPNKVSLNTYKKVTFLWSLFFIYIVKLHFFLTKRKVWGIPKIQTELIYCYFLSKIIHNTCTLTAARAKLLFHCTVAKLFFGPEILNSSLNSATIQWFRYYISVSWETPPFAANCCKLACRRYIWSIQLQL